MRHFLVLEMRHGEGMEPELAYANVTCFGPGEKGEEPMIDIGAIRTIERFDASVVKALIKDRDIITKSSKTLYTSLAEYIPDINSNHIYCKKIIGITRAYTPANSNRVTSFSEIRKQFSLTFKSVETMLKESNQQVSSQAIVDSVAFCLLIIQQDLCQKYALWQDQYNPKKKRSD